MAKYQKYNHGDPRNPINGQIKGIFFNPSVDYMTDQPPADSIYGTTRIKIATSKMVQRASRLYFSDFYCVSSKLRPHYVQLVMTQTATAADQLCQDHLSRISSTDRLENPFFFQTEDGPVGPVCQVACSSNRSFWIELFFTDDVDLSEEEDPTSVRYFGHRFGGEQGLRKNAFCSNCAI